MLGKVHHVQNLAAKNTSSALKSIQGIELLKYSGMPLHAATSLLSHSRGEEGQQQQQQQKNGLSLLVQFLYWPWFREMWSDFK